MIEPNYRLVVLGIRYLGTKYHCTFGKFVLSFAHTSFAQVVILRTSVPDTEYQVL